LLGINNKLEIYSIVSSRKSENSRDYNWDSTTATQAKIGGQVVEKYIK
jgi:hypothetical protein